MRTHYIILQLPLLQLACVWCVGVWVSMNVQVSSLGATHRHMERHNFNGMRDMKMDKVERFHLKFKLLLCEEKQWSNMKGFSALAFLWSRKRIILRLLSRAKMWLISAKSLRAYFVLNRFHFCNLLLYLLIGSSSSIHIFKYF